MRFIRCFPLPLVALILCLAAAAPAWCESVAGAPAPPSWAAAVGTDQHGHWADVRVGQVTQRMRYIAPGAFQMGSPADESDRGSDEAQYPVTLTRGYWLANTECTQGLWLAVMGNAPSLFTGDDNRPVEKVNWDDCLQFAQRLNGQVQGLDARLPTEAEWEFACRAGSTGRYAGSSLADLGWSIESADRKTHPVAQKRANPWGLFDMHGNVWEWCADWYGAYPSGAQQDPSGPASGSMRVLRGGCWDASALYCRSAFRHRFMPAVRIPILGFRICAPAR
jgi:sulfatase modifying factor 1